MSARKHTEVPIPGDSGASGDRGDSGDRCDSGATGPPCATPYHGSMSETGGTAARLTRADVAHLAGLARIDLSEAELDRMLGELSVILDAVAPGPAGADRGGRADVAPAAAHQRRAARRRDAWAHSRRRRCPAPRETEQQRFSVPRILDED